ncbi:DUF3040 domain-containing protein [Streptosporangium sandarakinum]|uniref:DUF3040 domain-containing protein n=1 Tax=Streptosporangium sandarakinum TaxID=1260955 RepID=UPI0034187EED
MAWSQEEERILLRIERHLIDEDPRLAARLESFDRRVRRREEDGRGRPSRRPGRSTVVLMTSWLLIATLIATLLILVLRHEAAALPL